MQEYPFKILFVCTEDWFFHSHFLPLIEAARSAGAGRIALATTVGDRREEIARLGVEVMPLDFERASISGFSALRIMWRLRGVIRRWRPDIVHFIALKPILLGGLAMRFSPPASQVFHVTGLGTLAEGNTFGRRLARQILFRLSGLYARRKGAAMLFENTDDVAFLRRYGLRTDAFITLLGGAGVDPDRYPPLPQRDQRPVRVAFVGRLIVTKGVDVLIKALDICKARGLDVVLDIYGRCDAANPGSFTERCVRQWAERENVCWHGHVSDIVGIWRRADICVVPTRTREGMPRAMLEAASCARPLIVTDVPGCRQFVRDGVEGLVVPPEDASALAEAIGTLADDAALRRRMGMAARKRVLSGYTKGHIISATSGVYRRILLDSKGISGGHKKR